GLLGLSEAEDMLSAAVCCALLGAGLIAFFATAQAVLQLGAADHVRGRVLGIWSMMVLGGQPIGSLLAGYAADAWGHQRPVLVGQGLLCGVCALTLAAVWLWFRPAPLLPHPSSSPRKEEP